jgi:hypothetical protein
MAKSTVYADNQAAKKVTTKPKASGNSKYAMKAKKNERLGHYGFELIDNTNGHGITSKHEVSMSNMRRDFSRQTIGVVSTEEKVS